MVLDEVDGRFCIQAAAAGCGPGRVSGQGESSLGGEGRHLGRQGAQVPDSLRDPLRDTLNLCVLLVQPHVTHVLAYRPIECLSEEHFNDMPLDGDPPAASWLFEAARARFSEVSGLMCRGKSDLSCLQGKELWLSCRRWL